MKKPVYNIVLGDSEGVLKMSLVANPAIEENFLAFSEDIKFSVNEEQRIVFGPSLRADYPIYRYDSKRGEYYVVFNKETIDQLYQKFMSDNRTHAVNLEHNTDVTGVYMIQSFIKDADKGIDPKGFESVSNGSWFTAYKVENDKVWESIKSGEFKGFSVEGLFELEEYDELDELINEIL